MTWLHFGQFRETRAMRNTGTGFVVLSHHSLFYLSLISIVQTPAIKNFHDVAEMSYKTETREEVTGDKA